MNILLTGATGFLGKYLVKKLAPKVDVLYVLVRSKSFKSAQRAFKEWKNVEFISGDIRLPDIVDEEKNLKLLRENLDAIVHAAAFYDIQGGYADSFLQNVMGTQNTLYFASSCHNLRFFHYVSTVAVSGDFQGVFTEDTLECKQNFYNHYSKTKYDAELLVRNWQAKNVQRKIYRPGIIVGDSENGEMGRVDGPYYFFRFLKELKERNNSLLNLLKFFPLPYDPKAIIPLIPVNWAAEMITKGVLQNKMVEDLSSYHLFAHDCPTVQEFIKETLRAFDIKSHPVPLPQTQLNPYIMDKVKLPRELLTYMYSRCVFDQKYFDKDLAEGEKRYYNDFKDSFFEYAAKRMKYS